MRLFFSSFFCLCLSLSADVSFGKEVAQVRESKEKAIRWLVGQQQADGAWEPSEKPAITGMVLYGMGPGHYANDYAKKGEKFLLDNLQSDGGLYRGTNHQNYNTSWSLIALAEMGKGKHKDVVRNARNLIATWQMDLNEKGVVDSDIDGGIGYGDGTPRANMANTLAPLKALHETKSFSSASDKKINNQALLSFLHRSQNLPSVNNESRVANDRENLGGFIYHPGNSFAGEMQLPNGQKGYRSYGSMTYAGLLCCNYAGVKRDSTEVKAALTWLADNFSVDENPRMKHQGLFYYYSVMALALSEYGVEELTKSDGQKIKWKQELTQKLLSLQHPDGYWENSSDRWMEGSPVLCTAYALMALNAMSK